MTITSASPRFIRPLFAAMVLLLAGACLAQSSTGGAGAPRRGEDITLNFVNADIEAVARTMAILTGRNVVVDPRVKGVISLTTERPVSPAVAFNQFAAQLRTQGYAVVDSAGLYKIVPEVDAKLQSGVVSAGPVAASSNQIVTQIFRLNHESAQNLLPVLRPLISANNSINVNPGNNSLVITDYADNLQRLGRIIAALDVSNASDIEIIPLKNALATDLAPLVTRLIESGSAASGAPGQTDTSFRTTLIAEPRGNSLILRAANPARVALVRSLVEKLDRPPAPGSGGESGNIHVVHLKNADATQLAITLRAALVGEPQATLATGGVVTPSAPPGAPGATGAPGANQATAPSGASASRPPSTGGQIQADASTNSLIISAPEPQYRQLRAVIDKLDGRRAQVFVESLIAEVNADKAAEFGVQWQGPLGRSGNSVIGLLGTNFGAGGNNIINLATQGLSGTTPNGVTPGAGLNFGAFQRTNGVYVLGFLARFLEQTGNGNILSTPNLLTLDNEEAKIVIGQNVPFVTGQFTNTGSGNNGSVNPFQTIERKDVGLTLRVRPQISDNGTVKLAIYQEVSSVQASSVNSASGLITNKRSIESSVLVEDGALVVLGGLLQDEYSGNQEKVPVLGDIPFVGNLFKNETRTRKKTNLMVFLRPVVVRDAPSSDSLSMDRYDLMRGIQQGAQPAPSTMLPIDPAPVLPQRAPAPTVPRTN
ncbi:type II secretion system secretin GspD [Polaromonas sp.]|uniref:type II secretion system secretin GspD n=1 Tax=Polaromonas sp. TaxID=1869339 RepID=UPI0039C9D956